jgi:hypothetical protein
MLEDLLNINKLFLKLYYWDDCFRQWNAIIVLGNEMQ